MPRHQTFITGISHRPGAREHLASLGEEADFELELEPDNKFDMNAVKVLSNGVHVGYIPREMAPQVKRLIERGTLDRCCRRIGTKSGSGIEVHYRDEAA